MVLVPVADTPSRGNRAVSWRTQTPRIDYSSCIRCMICWKFCPDDAIDALESPVLKSPNERVATLSAPVIDYDHCKGCGICAYECPEKCIWMELEGGLSK